MIDEQQALQIAQQNAAQFYRDISVYSVEIKLENGNWQIDYELKDKNIDGGGPHFIISAKTGEILEWRFEQ